MSSIKANIFPNVSVDYFNLLVESSERMSVDEIIIPNAQHAEASLVFLYSKAVKQIRIMGDLIQGEFVSYKLKDKWEKAVQNPAVEVSVIATDSAHDTYQFKFLKEHLGMGLNNHLYGLDQSTYTRLTQSTKASSDFNFTIIDNKSYRFEYDTIKHKAYLNFNDRNVAQRLNNYFERLKTAYNEPAL